jgi:hypothetical protein
MTLLPIKSANDAVLPSAGCVDHILKDTLLFAVAASSRGPRTSVGFA